jgi:hypothetical protein
MTFKLSTYYIDMTPVPKAFGRTMLTIITPNVSVKTPRPIGGVWTESP